MSLCEDYASRPADHIGGFIYVRIRIGNGSEQIRQQCQHCADVLGRSFGRDRFTPEQLANMPLVQDWSRSRPPCVRCGTFGTEEHHWAPRALFGEESDLWPTSWLCPGCHQRWHQTLGAAI
jgi:hypothetical protein